MSDVVHRTTLERKTSVNTPDYDSIDWVINPDMVPVDGVPQKYWKLTGDTLSEMSTGEKAAVDAAIAALPVAAPNPYGGYQNESVLARTTTTSATWQDKVTLVTPILPTGTYRVEWTCLVDIATNNKAVEVRLYDNTAAAVIGVLQPVQPARTTDVVVRGGTSQVTLTNEAKTFKLQFRSPDGTTTVGVQNASIDIWRVA